MDHVASTRAARVIVVEDEPVTRALFGGCLRQAGFEVVCLETAAGLRSLAPLEPIDLALLDIELPDDDGFNLATWLRARSEAGIIFVSRRSAAVDRVRGLELGGDDFLVKPPDVDELLARVRAVLRRRARVADRVVRFDGWAFDPERFAITAPHGLVTTLTQGEAAVLAAIIGARGRVVARDALRKLLADEPTHGNARSLDVLVHRLRKKLGEGGNVVPRVLLTVHGVGYRLGVDVTSAR